MTVTEEVVDFVRTATPPREALTRAAAELDRFRQAVDAGAGSTVVRALRRAEAIPGRPWTALVSGTAAAAGGGTDRPVWVAVCAAAEALADGGRSAEAVAVGSVVADAAAAALGDAHTGAGWSLPATAGTIGAAATAGRILGLGADHLRHMLGICATQAAGLTLAEGTDAAALQLGKAASNAVEAALLSRNGFTSAARPLE
ncbi:MAG: MmgE/PrpD family protein, partial [Actinomadura sp.]